MPRFRDAIPNPLLNDLVEGRWLPVVGAGYSRNCVVPFGAEPVTWNELGDALRGDVPDVDPAASPIESISAYEHAFSRPALIERVGSLVRAHDASPGAAHAAFAEVGFSTVLTTNFDFLLEHAYMNAHKRCLPVVEESQLSTPNRYPGPRLIKMHGDLHHPDSLVLTEDDYDNFLIRQPLFATAVAALFVERTPVLIGYSLEDPDTRQLLALVRSRLGKHSRPLWTILFNAKPDVVTRFERRGVKVVNIAAPKRANLGDLYEQLFHELAEHWRERLPSESVGADERVTANLRLPRGSSNRLCYFAIPASMIGWYRDNVFPEVEAQDLIPVTAREVFTLNDTTTAKIDTLIDRASAVIAEAGSALVGYEAALAAGRKSQSEVLFVLPDNVERPTPLWAQQIALRPANLDADPEEFQNRVRDFLARLSLVDNELTEPDRLLQHNEPGPALISAVSALELALRRRVKKRQEESARPPTMRWLLNEAEHVGLLATGEDQLLEAAVSKRNQVVHGIEPISLSEARKLVRQVMSVVNRLGINR